MSRHSVSKMLIIESPVEFINDNNASPNSITWTRSSIQQSINRMYRQAVKVDYTHPQHNDYPTIEESINTNNRVFDIESFKDMLFNDTLIKMTSDDYAKCLGYLDQIITDEEMIVDLSFTHRIGEKGIETISLGRQSITKLVNNKKTYYHNGDKPSLVVFNDYGKILNAYHEVTNKDNPEPHLFVCHYVKLGVKVNTIVNADASKITPAITVTDCDGKLLEVHWYYQNRYIGEDIIREMKPNFLNEDITDPDYFNAREIDFIDMLVI